jgi:hypothetical protein
MSYQEAERIRDGFQAAMAAYQPSPEQRDRLIRRLLDPRCQRCGQPHGVTVPRRGSDGRIIWRGFGSDCDPPRSVP